MNYRITKGDCEITKNVLTQLSIEACKKLEQERRRNRYEEHCPSYSIYNSLLDVLCYVEEHKKKNLTK